MRISDWSSDVCSSDQIRIAGQPLLRREQGRPAVQQIRVLLRGLPFGGGAGDALAHAQVVATFLDPAPEARPGPQQGRSEERRGGKECVSKGRSRWTPET